MSANVRSACSGFLRARQFMPEHPRRDVIANDEPRRFGPLLVIKRIFARGDFAPAGNAVGNYFNQNNLALIGSPETGLEKMDQRHPDLAQRDSLYFDSHGDNR